MRRLDCSPVCFFRLARVLQAAQHAKRGSGSVCYRGGFSLSMWLHTRECVETDGDVGCFTRFLQRVPKCCGSELTADAAPNVVNTRARSWLM